MKFFSSALPTAVIAFAVTAVPFTLLSFRSGPPPGRTGAPGEPTCYASGCHQAAGSQLFENSTAIQLQFPAAMEYQPGVTQQLTLVVQDPQAQVFGFELSVRDPANGQAGRLMPVDATTVVVPQGAIQYLLHTQPRADGRFVFQWTPPSQDVGPVTFYVAANAANNDFAPTGDRIHTRRFVVPPAVVPPLPLPEISQNGVVHGATFASANGLAPNTFGTVFGTNLVQRTQTWDGAFQDNRAPTQLGGARVLINGVPAFISFAGRAQDLGTQVDQINFIVPDLQDQGDGRVEVETAAGRSQPVFVVLRRKAPALFPFEPRARRYVASVQNDGSAYVGPADLFGDAQLPLPIRPAAPGDVIQLYGTGFGPTNPQVPAGTIVPRDMIARVDDAIRVLVGQAEAEVLFAGLAPGFIGLYQIVIRVPQVPDGEHEVVVEVGGDRTPGLLLAVSARPAQQPSSPPGGSGGQGSTGSGDPYYNYP